uniref:NADH-ubiquinone oxidoreductase chain 3 n=1 Tax=Himaloaesalus gaoligongshanus TaxID=2583518 RepID=A0A7L4VS60_9SCAR|nr:NADH dehydrogenase subunit 3 [Himaloaesalus gaoligongshanus]QCU46385.1 NADH dehydrogenase subunit 3 [Himaloaesalus gaoligongshanus]WQF69240.1 NADH dehydrogenase subunit 3 [Himaloaesalus gaoligongshanus]
MMMINYTSFMILMITMLMIMISTMISKKSLIDREKSSPFECGFDPKSSMRLPFSLQFFLIAVIFLIFDVEITLLLPMIMTMKLSNLMNYSIILSFFLTILLVGLYHEWKQGALKWSY